MLNGYSIFSYEEISTFFIAVDYYSAFCLVLLRENTTYQIDFTEIQELFSTVCVSEKTVFDNGPEY